MKTKIKNKREVSLDMLRGIAVLLMVLAHTIAFVYTGENSFLNSVKKFGDTVCFTIFLLVSGASSYLAYIRVANTKWKQKKKVLIRRLVKLLLGYYLVALISSLSDFSFPISSDWLENMFQILFFIKVPGYTEFLLPFIFYGFIIVIAWERIKKLLKNKDLLISIGILTYTFGFLLYNLSIPDFLIPLKALLIGHENMYRFPLFQYFWVFLAGLWLGEFFNGYRKQKLNALLKITFTLFVILSLTLLIKPLASFPYNEEFQRWPPSISFIVIGISFAFTCLALIKIKIKQVSLDFIKNTFSYFGKSAFFIYIVHIITLQLEHITLKLNYQSVSQVLASFIVLITITTFIVARFPAFFTKPKRKTIQLPKIMSTARKSKFLKDKYFLILIAIVGVSALGITFGLKSLSSPDGSISFNNFSFPEVKGILTGRTVIRSFSNQKWILKGTDEYSTLTYTIEIEGNDNLDYPPQFEIFETSQSGDMQKVSDKTYEAKIHSDNLDPGEYEIQGKLSINNEEYTTNIDTFTVSYPMYVIWTMDWEGADVSDKELTNIEEFSDEYSIPITQFFNPVIYISGELDQKRIDRLTDWILNREKIGDEIGLHLHMKYEIAEASGVEPIKEPHWTDYLENGHDVPCSEYSYSQFMKILTWAKAEFEKNNLGTPISFRAGGWFADRDTLRALDDSGFLIDSSGRDYYIWGNHHIKGHWNLKSTTQPYQPSRSNQNASTPAPNFSLWEFPNNGANSGFYQSSELIKRFDENYTEEILYEPKVVTYLSHPHAFSQDLEVLEPVYEYIDQYNVADDGGPVIYTTLEDAYYDIN
ncbi:acyltransferase family protein [Patescibacteria group bacterium]